MQRCVYTSALALTDIDLVQSSFALRLRVHGGGETLIVGVSHECKRLKDVRASRCLRPPDP